jgi:hypothetical protein
MRYPGISALLPPAASAQQAWSIWLARRTARAFGISLIEIGLPGDVKRYPNKRRLHKARYRSLNAQRGRTRRRATARLNRFVSAMAQAQISE